MRQKDREISMTNQPPEQNSKNRAQFVKRFTLIELISVFIILAISSVMIAVRYINFSTDAKREVTVGVIAVYNSQEQMLWSKMTVGGYSPNLASDSAIDLAIYNQMDLENITGVDSDVEYTGSWSEGSTSATLTIKDYTSDITRQGATLNGPAIWTVDGVTTAPTTSFTDDLYATYSSQTYDREYGEGGDFTLDENERASSSNDKIIGVDDPNYTNSSHWSGEYERIQGLEGDDFIDGQAGNDDLRGHAGNDILFGGEGDDWVKGGTGDDILTGGPGDDVIDGQAGSGDIAAYSKAISEYEITKSGSTITIKGPDGIDTVKGVEFFYFGNDTKISIADLPFN